MRKIILAAVILVLALIACTETNTNTEQPDIDPVDRTAPSLEEANAEQTPATAEPTTNAADPEVLKLFDRSDSVKSYSFDFVPLPAQVTTRTYAVKGDLASVRPVTAVQTSTGPVNIIYLDLESETASGYCLRSEGSCDEPNQRRHIVFDEYTIIWPHEWIEQIKYGEKVGSIMYNNKQVTRIKYEADGRYYEAYVDNYFGIPQRIAISTNPEMTEIVGGYEYRNLAVNSVKDADVTHQPVTV